jgi:hypothetical protein
MSAPFHPTGWSEAEIIAAARLAGIEMPPECLPGVKANLALLEDRWATVSAALQESGA